MQDTEISTKIYSSLIVMLNCIIISGVTWDKMTAKDLVIKLKRRP